MSMSSQHSTFPVGRRTPLSNTQPVLVTAPPTNAPPTISSARPAHHRRRRPDLRADRRLTPRLKPQRPWLLLLLLTLPVACAESYSAIALPNANTHTSRTLQEDNTDLAYEARLFKLKPTSHTPDSPLHLFVCAVRAQVPGSECLCFPTHRTMRAHASRLVVLTACAFAWQYTAENLSGAPLHATTRHISPLHHHCLTSAILRAQRKASTKWPPAGSASSQPVRGYRSPALRAPTHQSEKSSPLSSALRRPPARLRGAS